MSALIGMGRQTEFKDTSGVELKGDKQKQEEHPGAKVREKDIIMKNEKEIQQISLEGNRQVLI